MRIFRQMLFLTLCGIRNFTERKKVVTKYLILFSKLPYIFANSIRSCCYFSSMHDKKIKSPKEQCARVESESERESEHFVLSLTPPNMTKTISQSEPAHLTASLMRFLSSV